MAGSLLAVSTRGRLDLRTWRPAPRRPIRRRKCRWSWELGSVLSRSQCDDRNHTARLRNVRRGGPNAARKSRPASSSARCGRRFVRFSFVQRAIAPRAKGHTNSGPNMALRCGPPRYDRRKLNWLALFCSQLNASLVSNTSSSGSNPGVVRSRACPLWCSL
jgi:hypothetical protein